MRKALRLSHSMVVLFTALLSACGSNYEAQDLELHTSPSGIVGGAEVQEGDKRSLSVVMIYGEKDTGESFICTGSLIADKVVLTAAHCISDNTETMSVLYGRQPFKSTPENLEIESTLKHPEYHPGAVEDRNDIALIYLKNDRPKSSHLAPLGVLNKADSTAASYGYGRTEGQEESENFSEELGTLRTVEIKTERFTEETAGLLTLDQSDGAGVCFGDSGGPLLSKNGDVVGVAAGVVGDGKSADACSYQSYFTKVAFYRSWIKKNLKTP